MTNLFTKKIEGTVYTDDYEYEIEVTVTNDSPSICDGEMVCVSYFSEQFCKVIEWNFPVDEEPSVDEIADMISKREGRTVIF